MECYRNMDGTWNEERKFLLEKTSRRIYSSAGFTFVVGGYDHAPSTTQVFPCRSTTQAEAYAQHLRSTARGFACPARRARRLRPDTLPARSLEWYNSYSAAKRDAAADSRPPPDAWSHRSPASRCFAGSGEFSITLPGLGGASKRPVGDVST